MKILAICGHGLGSSLMLKLNVESCLKELGVVDAEVEVTDYGSSKGKVADLYVLSTGFGKDIDVDSNPNFKDKTIFIKQIMDSKEIKEKLKKFLEKQC